MTQTILGAGGAIGVELARQLTAYTSDIRLVSRNPQKVNEGDVLVAADLTDSAQTDAAVAGSDVCYLTVGIPYNTKLWQTTWPGIMRNAVTACMKYNTKLLFFDNVYALGADAVGHIIEDAPINPSSKKGEIRAEVTQMILDEMEAGRLDGMIARAPDFFGAIGENSVLIGLVYDNLVKGKKAQWLCDADVVYTAGYVPDMARGTAMLGNTADAWNQAWNLPVDGRKITAREWVQLFSDELGVDAGVQVLPSWMMRIVGLAIPAVRETVEMRYQYDRDYYFDSTKFNTRFDYVPTTHGDAVRETVAGLRGSQ